jgi:tetratricopeptide (TPR) repeat protein
MNCTLNIAMDTQLLIAQGNEYRAQNQPTEALKCYAQAFVEDMDLAAAWNNYGNVMRECGQPARAVPFLQHAIALEPQNVTAHFNLAVSYLIQGNYAQGWPLYEVRWNYEHLAGQLPKHTQPRWTGQDLKDKTILVEGEQGHGDNIQFVRFLWNLHVAGAKIKLKVTDGLIPLLGNSPIIERVGGYLDDVGEFDYWIPIMSIPGILGITLENLPKPVNYLNVDMNKQQEWLQILGPKTRMRVGFCWSGRRDAWLNRHKGMPFEDMLELIRTNSQYEWVNLQIDATPEEEAALVAAGVQAYPGSITSFVDTAALIMAMDVVIGVDTAVSHLSGSLGRPTWIMLNWFGTDWRWLLNRDDSPWYSTARLFRQPSMGDWASVRKKITQYLSWMKV